MVPRSSPSRGSANRPKYAFDPESNYRHAVCWRADFKTLWYMDVVVADVKAGDLDDIDEWMGMLFREHGLAFYPSGGERGAPTQVRQLMIDTWSVQSDEYKLALSCSL